MAEAVSTVLVVDDDPDFRSVLVDCLAEEGFRVVAAESAFAALDLARRRSPHVVITDVVLPGMDGLRLVAALRGEGLTAPIIVMSSHVAPPSLPDVPFLRKPFTIDDLIALLTSVLESPACPSHASHRLSIGRHW